MSRVLFVHQPTDGGVGRHVADLAEGLSERGHDVVLCSPRPLSGADLSGVEHRSLDLRRAIAPRPDIRAAMRLARLVEEIQPDLLHAHSSKAGAVARLARPLHPRLPVLYTPHGYSFAGHFEQRGERAAYRAIEAGLAPLASRVLCVCEAEARHARAIGPARRVRVVHNGIGRPAPGEPDPRLAELAQRGPVIGALTQARPGKGLESLIDAVPEILARHRGAQVAIVGDGPELEALRQRAQTSGVGHAVHFLGATRDPLSALRGMDVFVHPSWAESFPYVILEAMAAARAIVATDVGGVAEALVDGESAILVRAGDPAAISRSVGSLLEDPAARVRMGERAAQRVAERFTRSSMVDGTIAVYAELLGRAGRPVRERGAFPGTT